MAIIDSTLELNNGAKNGATDVVNAGAARIGVGKQIWFVATVLAASGGSAITLKQQSSVDEAFTSPQDDLTITVPANTPAGTKYVRALPFETLQYLRATTSASLNYHCHLTDQHPESWEASPDAVN